MFFDYSLLIRNGGKSTRQDTDGRSLAQQVKETGEESIIVRIEGDVPQCAIEYGHELIAT
jgi:hypothetical protein